MENSFTRLFFIAFASWLSTVCALTFLAPRQGTSSELVVDATVEAGSVLEIFLNGIYERSYRVPIIPAVRTSYHLKDIPDSISHVRLDPTDRALKKITFYKILFVSNGEIVREIGASELSKWQFDNMKRSEEGGPDAVEFVSQTSDPMIWSFGLDWRGKDKVLTWYQRIGSYVPIGILLAAFILFWLGSSEQLLITSIIFLTGGLHWLGGEISQLILNQHWPAVSIKHVLGNAGYSGASKIAEEVAVFVTCLLSLGIGVTSGFFSRRHVKAENPKPFSSLFIVFSIVAFAVFAFPDLLGGARTLAAAHHDITNFDFNNIFSWQYSYEMGWLPFRDYWFPYGGSYNKLGLFKADLLLGYLQSLLIFLGIIVGLYEVTGRKWFITSAIIFVSIILIERSFFVGTSRYLISLASLLLIISLRGRVVKKRAHFFLGVYLGLLFPYEPNQIMYAALAAFPFLVYQLIQSIKEKMVRSEITGYLLTVSGFSVPVLMYLYSLWTNGQLSGFLNFYAHMSAMAENSSFPAQITSWYRFTSEPSHLLFILLHVLICLTGYVLLRDRFSRRSEGWILLTISLLSSLVFLKMILRPFIADQLLILVLSGIVLYFLSWAPRWGSMQRTATALFLGALIGWKSLFGVVGSFSLEKLEHAFTIPENIAYAFSPQELDHESFFDRDKFVGIDKDHRELLSYFDSLNFSEGGSNVYVLGDTSYLYTLLKQKPTRYITFYDGAHLWAQKEVVQQLESEKRSLVVWDSSSKSFDGVPNVLRNPILFTYVMENYKPIRSFGVFEVLEKKDVSEAIPLEYWKTKLGEREDLGTMPARTSAAILKNCNQGQPCLSYLKLIPQIISGKEETVNVSIGGSNFSVVFRSTSKGINYIPLSRLWFWEVGRRNGLDVSYSWDKKRFQGVIVNKLDSGDILY